MTRARIVLLAALLVAAGAVPVGAAESVLSLCLSGLSVVTPETLWASWSFAPVTLLALAGLLALHLARRRPEETRSPLFLAGWALLALALVSPLCRLSAALVSAHMVQHMLLITVVPLLLALGGLGAGLRGRAALLPAATLFHGLTIWSWHLPAVYEAVLVDPLAHVAGYALLTGGAVLFWTLVLGQRHARPLAALGAVFTTMVHMGFLAALLTFAPSPFYGIMAPGAAAWGLTPLGDQQLAGLIMWVPGGIFYVVVGVTLALDAVGLGREAEA